MPIEVESPEQFGYGNIRCNLTESCVSDMAMSDLELNLNELILAYTDHLGKPELRERLAVEGAGLRSGDVLVTQSSATALFIVATSLLDESNRLGVMRSNYATNIETPRAIGCGIDFLDLKFEDGFRFDPDRLAALSGKSVINACNPSETSGGGASRVNGLLAKHKPAYLLILLKTWALP